MKTLGHRLKVARVKRGLNQTQTVERLSDLGVKVTQSYLSKLENNVNEPSIGQLKMLAKIYGTTLNELAYTPEELKEMNGSSND
ncbi:helix-turn-helix domain-containing protein [Erysipelothrix anatis]|uniref:helix-turn-helix domain-containing protein n=1 Tax=Erysipelothrix anatis TaxID=2683713 RepID=UPI00135C34F5|nr:helix-turn-helix transcriptional regulator [Erysipelothrix anatis]